jgi:hypothetical protein
MLQGAIGTWLFIPEHDNDRPPENYQCPARGRTSEIFYGEGNAGVVPCKGHAIIS